MKPGLVFVGTALLLLTNGCSMGVDPGPTLTANDEIEAGKAESVMAEIRMGSGDLKVDGGGSKLMTGTYRYSERVGRPMVRYDVTGSRGRLTIESPSTEGSINRKVNDWKVRMGSDVPLELSVRLGAGEADLDLSRMPLQSVKVEMGAGEMSLNLAGKYKKDVDVQVDGGAGEAKIRVPGDIGAVVDATLGIGGIEAGGLTKRDGKYYNDAYAEGKPAVRLKVRGGVGQITLSVGP
jgi:hypothetical protein